MKAGNLDLCKEHLERFRQFGDASFTGASDKQYFKVLSAVASEVPALIVAGSEGAKASKKGPFHYVIKSFVVEILAFLGKESTASPDAIEVLLAGLGNWMPLLGSFPETRKKLALRLVEIWAGVPSDAARLSALLAIHKAATLYPKLVETLCKKMYQAFGKGCKSLSLHTMGRATFLLNGLVEVYAIDPAKSAPIAKKYIKQLAGLLQASIKQPSKESLQKVYCWGFVWNIRFFARLVAHAVGIPNGKDLLALEEPILSLVQVNLGYNFVPRFYAHHYHLIGAASEVCRATKAYFPATPFLLQVLKRIVSTGTKPETGKPKMYDFTTICKVPKTEAGSRSYLDCAAEEALFLIGESLIGLSHLPAYPELSQPIAGQLRAIEAINKTWKVSKLCGTLAAKLDQHAKSVLELRSALSNAAPSKIPSTTHLEILPTKDVLDMFHKHTLKVREQRRKLVAASTDNKSYNEPGLEDSDVEEALAQKKAAKLVKTKKSVNEDGEEGKPVKKTLSEKREASTEEDELAEGVRQILAQAKKPKKGKTTTAGFKEDVLQAFDLSDF